MTLSPLFVHPPRPDLVLARAKPHTNQVNALAFLPGDRIVSTSEDGVVNVLAAADLAPLGALNGHEGPVNRLAFAPDGSLLATAGDDGRVRLWDLAPERGRGANRPDDGSALTCLAALRASSSYLRDVAVGDARVYAASEDHLVHVWERDTATPLDPLEGHAENASCLALRPDGKRLVSVSLDHDVRLWDTERGASLGTLYGEATGAVHVGRLYLTMPQRSGEGHGDPPKHLAWLADGRLVSVGRELIVWDPETRTELTRTKLAWPAEDLAVLERPGAPPLLAVCAYDVQLFTLEGEGAGSRLVRRARLPAFDRGVKALALDARGERVAIGSKYGDVVVMRLAGATDGPVQRVTTLAVSGAAGTIAAGDNEAAVRLHRADDGALVAVHEAHPTPGQRHLEFARDGSVLVTTGDAARATLWVWDARTGASRAAITWPGDGRDPGVGAFTVSATGGDAVVGPSRGAVATWDLTGARAPEGGADETRQVSEVALSDDGRFAVCGAYYAPPGAEDDFAASTSHLEGWDLEGPRRLWARAAAKKDTYSSFMFGPPMIVGDRVLARTGTSDELAVFDRRTGEPRAVLPVRGWPMHGALLEGGRALVVLQCKVAAGGEDDEDNGDEAESTDMAVLIDVAAGAVVRSAQVGDERAYWSALSPDGALFVGARDRILCAWDVRNAEVRLVGTYEADAEITVVAVDVGPDGAHVVAAGTMDGRLVAFRVPVEERIAQ